MLSSTVTNDYLGKSLKLSWMILHNTDDYLKTKPFTAESWLILSINRSSQQQHSSSVMALSRF